MFSKFNSKILNFANLLLLGQVVIGVIYFLMVVSQLIFPAGDFVVENEEWMRILTIILMGLLLLFVINHWKSQIFGTQQIREEKIFNFATLAVFDVAACMAISYLLSMPFETNMLSTRSMLHSLTSAAAVAIAFLALFLIVPKVRVLRGSFSWLLNCALLVILLGLGWSVAWLFSVMLCGPDGSSEVTQAVYAQQIFRFSLISLFLAGLTVVLVVNGKKLSKGRVALPTAAERGRKLLGAERISENKRLRDENRELKEEVARLKREQKAAAKGKAVEKKKAGKAKATKKKASA